MTTDQIRKELYDRGCYTLPKQGGYIVCLGHEIICGDRDSEEAAEALALRLLMEEERTGLRG